MYAPRRKHSKKMTSSESKRKVEQRTTQTFISMLYMVFF